MNRFTSCVRLAFMALTLTTATSSQLVPPDATVANATSSFAGGFKQHFGFTVDSGADWDGDGLEDLVAGGVTPNLVGQAEVRVIYHVGTTPLEFKVTGITSKVWGVPAALVRDLNGHGKADLVIGVPEWTHTPGDPDQADIGQFVVFYGENWSDVPGTQTIRGGDVVIKGLYPHRRVGFSVSDAGDVDGDGFHDLLVGAPGCDPLDLPMGSCSLAPLTYKGRTYLFLGGPNGMAALDPYQGLQPPAGPALGASGLPMATGPATPGFTMLNPDAIAVMLEGQSGRDHFGFDVESVGDLNGDGKSEFAVGAIQAYRSCCLTFTALTDASSNELPGYVDVFKHGLTAPIAHITPDLSQTPDMVAAVFGASISTVGDLNIDLVPELVIGAPGTYKTVGGMRAFTHGAVFGYSGAGVFLGAPGAHMFSSLNLFEPNAQGLKELGPDAGFGLSVAGSLVSFAGPVLPDLPDLAVGAWNTYDVDGAVFVLTPDFASGEVVVQKRIAGDPNHHTRFGTATVLGRIYSSTIPAIISGAWGQALPGSVNEEGFVHVFNYGLVFP